MKNHINLNAGMQRKTACTLEIPECMKEHFMKRACYLTISVFKTCRQHSGGNEWKKFTELIMDVVSFVNTGKCIDGNGLQAVWSVYETYTECIDYDVNTGYTQEVVSVLFPFVTSSNELQYELVNQYCSEPRDVPYLDQKVRIYDEKSAHVKMKPLSPNQIAARKVRKYVNSHIAPDTRRQKVIYIDSMDIEEFDNMLFQERIYFESKYAINERASERTLKEEKTIDEYIEQMELTPTQKEVLTLRLSGYGLQAIATYRGTSKQAVAKTLQQIAEKARKIAELCINEWDMLAQYMNEIGTNEDDENRVFTEKTESIDVSTLEKAGKRYEKTACLREKHAENVQTMLHIKNKCSHEILAENARICKENEHKYYLLHEFLRVEDDAKELAMYAK